jgi:glycolate oxidase FAD binding subunit
MNHSPQSKNVAMLAPSSIGELVEMVRSTPRLLPVGAGTKPRLSAVEAAKLSTTRLSGILEYEPSEFTFTALAGTPVRELVAALAERGQYLPFEPPWQQAGATLGGTVAAGVSGPGRFRFGGIRDFILGVRFVDGLGRLLRMGGKVVKNAAGFDLPKFFVGSLGRFGVLVELTFKVFPAPASTLTLKLKTNGASSLAKAEAASRLLNEASNTRWELDALELLPEGEAVAVRLAGPGQALNEISREILARWPGETMSAPEAETLWSGLREFRWPEPESPLFKVPLTTVELPPLLQGLGQIAGARVHVSGGGNVAFISLASIGDAGAVDELLRRLNLSGVALRGNVPLWLGLHPAREITRAVKHALDPNGRYPGLNE